MKDIETLAEAVKYGILCGYITKEDAIKLAKKGASMLLEEPESKIFKCDNCMDFTAKVQAFIQDGEGMKKQVCGCDEDPDPQAPGYHTKNCDLEPYGYNEAIDDLLTLAKEKLL